MNSTAKSRLWLIPAVIAAALPAACKPPASDADMAHGDIVVPQGRGPSEPLPSPDVEGALWVPSTVANRILYGRPGQPPLMALACDHGKGQSSHLQITRFAPADEGAGAFLALIGNSHVARIPVDAVKVNGVHIWQGNISLDDPRINVLTGRREVSATLPGAGRLVLHASHLPAQLVEQCRAQFVPGTAPAVIDPSE